MHVLLDTSVAIALRDGESHLLSRREGSRAIGAVSIVTMVELEGGVDRTEAGRQQRRAAVEAMYEDLDVLPFTAAEARVYGRIVERLGFARAKIIDRMIASTALVAKLPVATLNPRDFETIEGLVVEDWSA